MISVGGYSLRTSSSFRVGLFSVDLPEEEFCLTTFKILKGFLPNDTLTALFSNPFIPVRPDGIFTPLEDGGIGSLPFNGKSFFISGFYGCDID